MLWHGLWDETYSNPRYAELVPRLERLFFAPVRQRKGAPGRLDGALYRRMRFVERRTLAWYRAAGLGLLLTPDVDQVPLFDGPAVLDLDDPVMTLREQDGLRARVLRHVVTPTDEIAEYVRATNTALGTTVVPQGVDLERAARARHEETRGEILRRLGLPLETPIVGYHAPLIRLSGERGAGNENLRTFDVDVLVSAIRRLWSDDVPFVTVLVGRPSSAIEALVREEKHLVLAGYVDRHRLFDWVGTFDVGTYPRSVDFGGRQSVKLLEYMANSAAIVAMRTHETRLLEKTASGYVADDAEHFRDLLRRVLSNRDERLSLINRGRAVVAEYDWSTLAARYDRVLAGVAGDP